MDGLFFIASIAAIVLVMLWVAQNEGGGADRPTKGLFAMREPTDDAADSGKKVRPGQAAERGRTQAASAGRRSVSR